MNKIFLLLIILIIIGTFGVVLKIQSTKISSVGPTSTMVPQVNSQSPPAEMTFMIAGDAMFGRAIYAYFHNDLTEPLKNLGQDFFQGDIKMLNLEGPMVEQEFTPDTNPNNLIMKFPPQTKNALEWLGINTVGLANNHTLNQGAAALQFTRETLNSSQIATVGNPQNDSDLLKTFQKESQKISIFAIDILANTPDLTEQIKEQKAAGAFVIVFPHWGTEYQTKHNATQEKLAHLWIQAGADIIIGSHPHVIQDAELYQGKPIFYSLGNFLFDQTFSQNTQRGLIVKGKISASQLTLELLVVKSTHLRLELLEGEEKEKIIEPLENFIGVFDLK